MEHLVAAAICLYRDDEDQYPFIYTAKRHADIYELLHKSNIKYSRWCSIEGFMTDTFRFVDRYEAKHIAVKAAQLIVPMEETCAALYSEDVW